MGVLVTSGAGLLCTFGTAPCSINVTSQSAVLADGKPAATIQDVAALTNISGFGMCTSLANPQVASATAAALGVLTPQPCMPAAAGTWIPSKPTVLIGGKPCLCNDSSLMCANGAGQISIKMPGQTKVMV